MPFTLGLFTFPFWHRSTFFIVSNVTLTLFLRSKLPAIVKIFVWEDLMIFFQCAAAWCRVESTFFSLKNQCEIIALTPIYNFYCFLSTFINDHGNTLSSKSNISRLYGHLILVRNFKIRIVAIMCNSNERFYLNFRFFLDNNIILCQKQMYFSLHFQMFDFSATRNLTKIS